MAAAAGGAALGVPDSWLAKRGVPQPGTPTALGFHIDYGGFGAAGQKALAGQQFGVIRGPGVITSLYIQSVFAISTGFQLFSQKGGNAPQPMLHPSAAAYWLTTRSDFGTPAYSPQVTNPNMLTGYIYPAQEIGNLAAPGAIYADAVTGFPEYVQTQTTYPAFTAGTGLLFQSSFANGYAFINATGTTSASNPYGHIQAWRYTLYGQFPFDDECRVVASPGVLDNWGSTSNARVDITIGYSVLSG